jgi:CheY-like chemotaxis protein
MARILLIEDNELNRDMLSRRLERAGHEVLAAIDGKSAFDLLQTERVELVILDLRLPDMSGLHVITILRGDPVTAHVPILVLTACAMDADRERARSAGCDEYETKPVDLPRVLEKIQQLLTRSSLPGQQAGNPAPRNGLGLA